MAAIPSPLIPPLLALSLVPTSQSAPDLKSQLSDLPMMSSLLSNPTLSFQVALGGFIYTPTIPCSHLILRMPALHNYSQKTQSFFPELLEPALAPLHFVSLLQLCLFSTIHGPCQFALRTQPSDTSGHLFQFGPPWYTQALNGSQNQCVGAGRNVKLLLLSPSHFMGRNTHFDSQTRRSSDYQLCCLWTSEAEYHGREGREVPCWPPGSKKRARKGPKTRSSL